MASFARHRPSLAVAAVAGALALLSAVVAVGNRTATTVAAGSLLVALLVPVVVLLARSWPRLICGMALVDLLIPNDGRYTLNAGLPFQLEPYRIVAGLLLIGWVLGMLVDPRIRARRTGFEAPIALIIAATLGSDLLNASRVATVSSFVVKALWLFLSFILFLYLVVSVLRTRSAVEKLLTVLVSAGCVVAVGGLLQRQTGLNVFNYWHPILPFLQFNGGVELGLTRGGNIRAIASAGHPIELSNTLAMLTPLAAYLAISRRQHGWWAAAAVLVLGSFASGSRTGVVSLGVMVAVCLWLRPRQVLRCWPAVIPVAILVHFFVPGAIGGVIEGFFPKQGLIAQQTEVEHGLGGKTRYATRLSRVGPELSALAGKDALLLGVGYGTRVVGRTGAPSSASALAGGEGGAGTAEASGQDNAQVLDDQWLDTIVETGILGMCGWLLLFIIVIRRLGRRAKIESSTAEGWLPVAIAASIAGFAATMGTYDAFGFIQATLLAYLLIGCAAVLLRLPPSTGDHLGSGLPSTAGRV